MSANDIINERGYWQGLTDMAERPVPPADIPERTAHRGRGSADHRQRRARQPGAVADARPRGDRDALAYASGHRHAA